MGASTKAQTNLADQLPSGPPLREAIADFKRLKEALSNSQVDALGRRLADDDADLELAVGLSGNYATPAYTAATVRARKQRDATAEQVKSEIVAYDANLIAQRDAAARVKKLSGALNQEETAALAGDLAELEAAVHELGRAYMSALLAWSAVTETGTTIASIPLTDNERLDLLQARMTPQHSALVERAREVQQLLRIAGRAEFDIAIEAVDGNPYAACKLRS